MSHTDKPFRMRTFDLDTENEKYLYVECVNDKGRIAELEKKLEFAEAIIAADKALQAGLQADITELEKLKAFARDITVLVHDAMDLNGGDVEEIALKHGLLKSVEVFEPCSEVGCICAEVGDFPLYCNRTTELIAPPKESER